MEPARLLPTEVSTPGSRHEHAGGERGRELDSFLDGHVEHAMAEQISIFGIVVGIALLLTSVGLIILAFAVFGRVPKGSRVAEDTG